MADRRPWNPQRALPHLRDHELLELKLRAWQIELAHPTGKYYTSHIKRQIATIHRKIRRQPQDPRHPNVPLTGLVAAKASPQDWARLAELRRKLRAHLAKQLTGPQPVVSRPFKPAENLDFPGKFPPIPISHDRLRKPPRARPVSAGRSVLPPRREESTNQKASKQKQQRCRAQPLRRDRGDRHQLPGRQG